MDNILQKNADLCDDIQWEYGYMYMAGFRT